MTIIHYQDMLKGLSVRDAMRRQVISLPRAGALSQAINLTIKYKVNALLITGENGEGQGVVSKTDLMGAYYAGLSLDTPAESIMTGPPLFCGADESLDAALETMRTMKIHRLYVQADQPGRAQGVLAYPDIVGLLYRFCHKCERSLFRLKEERGMGLAADNVRVREVMTPAIHSQDAGDSLYAVMEGLAAQRLGAVLIRDAGGAPVGVVSKTDLMNAYRHGVPVETTARAIMSAPVQACGQEDWLARALHKMIFFDLHRLFVWKDDPKNLVGVLSLSDAARFRSGTCRACLTSRIKVG
jgi:CBS domain-containing protein